MLNINNINQEDFKRYIHYSSKKNEISKYYYFHDKVRSLYGELLSRMIISIDNLIPMENIVIKKNQYGKPYLLNRKSCFNISHSGEWVVLATSKLSIGIDIEMQKKINFHIMDRFFNENEIHYIERQNEEEKKLRAFYKVWTRKESYVKAIGIGLQDNLNFDTQPEHSYKKLGDYYIRSYFLNNYIMSICSKADPYDCEPIIVSKFDLHNYLNKGAPDENYKLL
ncbi:MULTISPECIES: 4'-phosphopantetheinyl transferase family protein [Cytobacillus]|nr:MULTISPECIES: 4'-phosphopantetheinyl transferase superfamily protein [Cytobacillus]